MKTLSSSSPVGVHAAIIMDGSGRWAQSRGWTRSAGHLAGVRVVRRVVDAAPELGIGTLTLHSFSSDNWRRPTEEVAVLLGIFEDYLRNEIAHWVRHDVRVSVFGRRNRVPESLRQAMRNAESATAGGRRLHLRLAIDYSGRDSIVRAARLLGMEENSDPETFSRMLAEANGDDGAPDVDLLIRTGGEQRLSDFFLWECAYAELCFTPVLWPDFSAADFSAAIEEFHARDRRYGRIEEKEAPKSSPHAALAAGPRAMWRE
jgi:undecaprenyl diphosphate synthase